MFAVGIARRADQAAQFHQRLVERCRSPARATAASATRHNSRRPAVLVGIVAKPDQPAEQPHGVGFEDRGGRVERDRHDRAGRVAPDARQLADVVQRARELAAVSLDDHLRGAVQLPGPAIVAQSFPEPQHFAFVGSGQRRDRRERWR